MGQLAAERALRTAAEDARRHADEERARAEARLELAREGKLQLRQFEPFGKIYLRRAPEDT